MTSRKGMTKLLLCVAAVLLSANLKAQTKLEVTHITPAGNNVPAANQILINFNKPVVPLGDSRRSAEQVPVRITPKLNCQWQWISTKQLACQLNREDQLKLSTKYKIVVGTKALNESGDALTKPYQHVIQTRRPYVSYTNFAEIEQRGFPVFYVYFDQEVSKRSVARLIKFEYELNGKTKQIRARVLTRLPSQKNNKSHYPSIKGDAKFNRQWLVQPARALPKASKIRLHTKAGLQSKEGPLKSVEGKTLTSFHSFDDFRFVGLSCANTKFKNIFYSHDQLDRARCNPQANVQLAFSSPFNVKQFSEYFDLRQAGESSDLLDEAWQTGYQPYIRPVSSEKQYFYLGLPNGLMPSETIELRAKQSERPLAMPKDIFGQALNQHINVKFNTRTFSPNVSLPENYVVLEQGVESDAPIELTNINSLSFNYELANGEKRQHDYSLGFGLNQIATMPIGIRKLLDNNSGYLSGYFKASSKDGDYRNSNRNGKSRVYAQVTPFQVHAKLGSFSSLVWVTELASGKLVDSAKVELITSATRSNPEQGAVVLHSSITNDKGVATLPGKAELKSTMESRCEKINCGNLWLRVTQGRDEQSAKALLLLDDEFAVELGAVTDYELYYDPREAYGHVQAWGTTAQGLYRPGDTINYKIYVRDQNLKGLTSAPKKSYSLVVEDEYGNSILEREDIELDQYGSFSGEIVLASTATMGEYTFELSSDFAEQEWYPLSVQVTDFTPAPFKLSQTLNGSTFTAGQELVVDVQAQLYAGGPYTDADADFELISMPQRFDPQTEATKGYEFSNYERYQSDNLLFKQVDLDAQGKAQILFELPELENGVVSASLIAQTLMEDERGKAIVSRSRASYLSVDRLVGLKAQKWVYQVGQQVTLDTLVIDPQGSLIEGVEINVRIDRESPEEADAHGFEDGLKHQDWVEVSRCNLTSALTKSNCQFTAKHAGRHRATATIKDTQGREHSLRYWVWVSGKDISNWNSDSSYKLELVAEKSSFSVGETARFIVKNPFPGAQALITIERHGILESWQQRLHGSAPVIEFELKPSYAPGAYLSVVVTKPRTGDSVPKKGEADFDKPAFKIGYKKLTVNNPSNPLKLEISSDSEVYKPGDKVRLTVRPEFPKLLDGQEIEFSISVLDESVLDLVQGGSDYFDPILGFNKLENLDLQNFNLLTKLLGLQQFSEPQSDEQVKQVLMNQSSPVAFQAQSLRLRAPASVVDSFDSRSASSVSDLEEVIVTGAKRVEPSFEEEPAQITVRDNLVDNALWKEQVSINDDGSATIEFVVPDNLTAWRVLAVAATATDKFSLSEHSFKVNQLTEVRSVMPNQVTETDVFNAGFSVLNRSDQARSIDVSINASGSVEGEAISFNQTVELAAHARQVVYFPNTALRLASGQHQGKIDYLIVAGDERDKDALRHSLEVNKQKNLTTVAAYGSASVEPAEYNVERGSKETIKQDIKFPENIAGDLGGLKVALSSSIISNVGGAFEYMKNYPYACWEQKLSTAVMASHHQRLGEYLSDDFSWQESKALPQKTLNIAAQSQAPNGGMAYFRAEDAFVSPYLSAYTALAFTWLEEAGYQVPKQVQENLHEYLNGILNAKKDPNSLSNNATATLHAVAMAALAKTGDVSRTQLLRAYADHDVMSLFGKAQLLNAFASFEDTQAQQTTLLEKILAQSTSSAGKIVFSEARDSSYVRLHSSDSRSSCAILDTLVSRESSLSEPQLTSKLVRSIVAKRGTRNHWENTQDNVYCLNAISNYAQSFETQVPELNAKVTLDESFVGEAKLSGFNASADSIELPMQPELVGKSKTLSIESVGKGRLYYQTLLSFNKLEPQEQRENAGFDIRRERSVFRDKQWQLIKSGDEIKRGETVRTDLFLSTPVERDYVAVRDPVPGGLEPVNFDLATNGLSLEMRKAKPFLSGSYYYQHDAWQGLSYNPSGFYHRQLGHDAVIFYSDYVYEGYYHLSYYAQAIATGDFVEQPVHVEEMYDPDIYGKGISGNLKVVE